MSRLILLLLGCFGMLTQSCAQAPRPPYSFYAAMYTSEAGVSQELEVFPLDGEPFRIPLSFPLGVMSFSPDGKTMYASALATPPGLFSIELATMRVTTLPGSSKLGFDGIAAIAGQRKLIIAGGGFGAPCGIFELSIPSGSVRNIVADSRCDPLDPLMHWRELSVSPDGTRATAMRNHRPELINLVTGEVGPFVPGFALGEWSPDGKWYAAFRAESGTVVLLDGHTFEERGTIGVTDLNWSPDSRYLLNKKFDLQCGLSEAGTLEMVNVETLERTEIKSSRCLVDRKVGWVSSEIGRTSSARRPLSFR